MELHEFIFGVAAGSFGLSGILCLVLVLNLKFVKDAKAVDDFAKADPVIKWSAVGSGAFFVIAILLAFLGIWIRG